MYSAKTRVRKKTAVLVSDDLHFGPARRFFAVHALHDIDVGLFRDKGNARAWLVGRK